MGNKNYDLFISYKSENLNLANQVYERLSVEGFSIWFDKARLDPGCNWHAEIEDGCESSRIILPILTPAWKTSDWTKFETYGAEFVIPLIFEGDFEVVVPLPLRKYQTMDFCQANEGNWPKLIESIRQYLGQTPPEKHQRLVSLPYVHNPYFVGREKELLQIHENVCQPPSPTLTQGKAHAISGMGGVGKTTLAREYAEKFWRLYQDILWVQGDRPFALEFQRLAEDLKLIKQPSKDPSDDAQLAMNELSKRIPRLLIIDNAPDEESIQGWVPKSGNCCTLITSRFTGWSVAVQNIPVQELERVPARELLFKRSGLPDSGEEREFAGILAEKLGYLPLALEQAAAFIREAKKNSFNEYLAYYAEAESRRDLLAQRVLGATQYPKSIATTWLVTVERLGPLARSILTLSSFLAPNDIPRALMDQAGDFLRQGVHELSPASDQDKIKVNSYLIDKALAELNRFSMVSLHQESFSVHRLVQSVLRGGLGIEAERLWAEHAVRAVASAFPKVEFASWPLCARLLPHVQTLASFIDEYSFGFPEAAIIFPEAAIIMSKAGNYLNARAQYAEAEPLLVRTLAICEKALGGEHLVVATSLNNLAALYISQGKYAEAEPLYLRALAVRGKALRGEHPDIAQSLNNLALLYANQGKYAEAEPLWVRALAVREKALGGEHPDVATSLNNLAFLYNNQGKYAEAEPLYLRALAVREKALGGEHPDVAISLNNLAALYISQGKYAEAEPLLVRALAINEKALGAEHPFVAAGLNNLADLYINQGKYAEAEPLLVRTLAICEKALGGEHPDIATSLNSLARLYANQGKYAEAEPLWVRALAVREKALGAEHPFVATGLNNLAALYISQGKYAEAEPLLVRALAIYEKALGAEHPDVAESLNNLAALYASQGKYAEAEPLLVRALTIYEKALGAEHPDVATVLENYAGLLLVTNRESEAETLRARASAIRKGILNPTSKFRSNAQKEGESEEICGQDAISK